MRDIKQFGLTTLKRLSSSDPAFQSLKILALLPAPTLRRWSGPLPAYSLDLYKIFNSVARQSCKLFPLDGALFCKIYSAKELVPDRAGLRSAASDRPIFLRISFSRGRSRVTLLMLSIFSCSFVIKANDLNSKITLQERNRKGVKK